MNTKFLCLLMLSALALPTYADGVDDLFDKAAKKRGGVNVQVDSSIYRDNDKGVDQARAAAEEVDEIRSRAASASESQKNSIDNSKSKNASSNTNSRIWRCKLYCRSSSGSMTITHKDIAADSRKDAAKIASENSSQICRSDGSTTSNYKEFDSSQCQIK